MDCNTCIDSPKIKFINIYLIDGTYVIAPTIKEAIDVYILKYPSDRIKRIELINFDTPAIIRE